MRRRAAEKRDILADPKYKSQLVAKFINVVMVDGKRSIAEKVVYAAFDQLEEKAKDENVIDAFAKVVDNARPRMEVKSRRVGGATYQVPIEIRADRGTALALRWIRDYARQKKGKPMQVRLADELVAAYKGEGGSVKRKEEVHRMAEANKAFSHYRW